MAECDDDRYRPPHAASRLAYRATVTTTTDDDEDESTAAAAPASAAVQAAAAAHLFGGSFQFIVQEQAKSMVAIQELQQEVGSLLLFRQAVLAALPHLQSTSSAITKATSSTSSSSSKAIQQSWTRRKQQLLASTGSQSYRSLQDGSSDPVHHQTPQQQQHHNVADSGFSTEASNSNTSPRSSRFDTASSSEMTMPHAPMEKELLQHLERVQQRLARLRKDEDRLLTLLNRQQQQRPMKQQQQLQQEDVAGSAEDDELWLLLEEIQLRSQAVIRSSVAVTTKDAKPEELEQEHQGMSHKKRVSFQQQQQQQLEKQQKEEAAGTAAAEGNSKKKTVVVAAVDSAALLLPSPPAALVEPSRYQPPTRDQVAAILRLTNPVELQRHLLRALLDNQSLREQVEAGRSDVASRDAQWRSNSQLAGQQMTALRDENEDLRFQLEEQKIELEGTKARLRMMNRSPANALVSAQSPALTSIRMRAASTQTDLYRPLMASVSTARLHSGTQTDVEDNNNKVMLGNGGRALPRVVDASPKPKLSKLVDLAGNNRQTGSGSSWGDEEDRPSVERRSYNNSRIPTPIKPTVIPIVSTPTSATKVVSSTTPSKRELPELPLKSTKSTPATPLSNKHRHHHHGFVSGSKSDPASKVRVTVVTAAASQRVRTRLALTDSLSSSETEHHPPMTDKTEDYFDSINANSGRKNSRNSPYQQQQQPVSPTDSLERSLPEVGIHYHYMRASSNQQQRDNRSYNSQSSAGSSTTPSNSLSFHQH